MKRCNLLATATVAVFLSGPTVAEPVAIVGATVHTMTDAGTLKGATVIIEDGQISEVRRSRCLV